MLNEFEQLYSEIRSYELLSIDSFDDVKFNEFIIVGCQSSLPITSMLGRVVQVRKEHGCYGSDQVFIRQMNGELQLYENQWFYYLPEVFKNRLTELYKAIH